MTTGHLPARERAAWQTIDSGQLLLIATAGLFVVVAITQVAAVGLHQPNVAIIFGVLIALGELFRMVMPGNREVAPIASAGAMGYALLVGVGPEGAAPGAPLGVVPAEHPRAGRRGHRGRHAGRLAAAHRGRPDAAPGRDGAPAVQRRGHRAVLPAGALLDLAWYLLLAVMGVVVIASCFTDVLIAAMIRAETVRARFGIALRDEIAAKMALCAATSATAMLIAVATTAMGEAALLIFTVPILVTQFAFRRYAGIRATYLETVRALSRVTEVGGYVEAYHSRRVSRLAVAMGRELGMAEEELLELEYAALMHDIGQLSLGDPIPGGATVLASPAEQRRIAELGAEVIKQTGYWTGWRTSCSCPRTPTGRVASPSATRASGRSRRRSRAASSRSRTPTTTWSATPPTGTGAPPCWSGSGSTRPPSTTRRSWRRSAGSSTGGCGSRPRAPP